jgi:RimJ/RimL family protein N-acetyltransferase
VADASRNGFMPDGDTQRLSLLRWRREYAAGLAEVNSSREVMQYLNGGTPLTRVESTMVSDRVLRHWVDYRFGLWAVIEKEGGQMLGFAGICHPLWFPEWAKGVEVGWRLRHDAWGRGYATEAGREALRAGFARGIEEIVAFVHPDNHRSAAVAARLGMEHADRVRHPDRPHDLDVFIARAV